MFYPEKESKRSKGGREGGRQLESLVLWLVVLLGGGRVGGITIDDVSQLDTTASLGYGQLQTCLYNRPSNIVWSWETERVISIFVTLRGGVVSPASKRLMAGNHIPAFYIKLSKIK